MKNEFDDVIGMIKQTAMNVAATSEQMGLLNTRVHNLDIKTRNLDEKIGMIEGRMENYEERLRVTRAQSQNIKNSIHSRVNHLLNIKYENHMVSQDSLFADKYYKSGFISRCYADARRESRLGCPYTETLQRDYEEVLNYINEWVPPAGTNRYKNYLDNRRAK